MSSSGGFCWTFHVILLMVLSLVVLPVSPSLPVGSSSSGASSGQQLMGTSSHQPQDRPGKCVAIEIPLCQNIGYNLTYMPNIFNHDSQEEASLEVHQFWPLVSVHCSEDLRLFLCSMYAPICVPNWRYQIPACRSLCESARNGCAPLMRQYGFTWPKQMECELLPTDERACMSRQNRTTPRCGCCKKPLIALGDSAVSQIGANLVETGGVRQCAMPCQAPYFSAQQHQFGDKWITVWAVLCFISTLITVLTFFMDTQRFNYPERPIIFLSCCYFFVSVGYLVRVAVGHEAVACENGHIRYGVSGFNACVIVFLLLYYFGMASSIWWVLLTVTWFLAAGLKWGSEAIAKYAHVYQYVAWFLPGIQCIHVLIMKSADGDPVAGICYVGNSNLFHLRLFVLVPLCVYLALGTLFLLAGFVSLLRIRSAIKASGECRTEKLEKLMVRIGIFGVLYSVPATVVIACYVYETLQRDKWEQQLTCQCDDSQPQFRPAPPLYPEYAVFMLKYFMSLAVGVTSSFWIWTGKTWLTWKRFFSRCCRHSAEGRSSAPELPMQAHGPRSMFHQPQVLLPGHEKELGVQEETMMPLAGTGVMNVGPSVPSGSLVKYSSMGPSTTSYPSQQGHHPHSSLRPPSSLSRV